MNTPSSLTIKIKAMKVSRQVLLKTSLLLFLVFGYASITHAQSTSSKEEKRQEAQARIKSLVDSQNYVFNAQMAMPMGGRTLPLTGDYYDLKIGRTAVVSYLPFFGRAYSAPLDPAKAGIQFSSKNFDYKSIPGKKGGWDILIKTKDTQENWQLSLSITVDGYASLQVNSDDRQSISFTGVIAERKKQP